METMGSAGNDEYKEGEGSDVASRGEEEEYGAARAAAVGGGATVGAPLKKGSWTPEEDALLKAYVELNGDRNWNQVRINAGLNRCGKSCRLRWTNHLRPQLKKRPFDDEEKTKIIEFHHMWGNKWARMAAMMPGRTDNEIKNFWNIRRKRCMKDGSNIYPNYLQSQLPNQHMDPDPHDSAGKKQPNGSQMHGIDSLGPEIVFEKLDYEEHAKMIFGHGFSRPNPLPSSNDIIDMPASSSKSEYNGIFAMRASSSSNTVSEYNSVIGMHASSSSNIVSAYNDINGMRASSSNNIPSGYDGINGMHASSLSNIASGYNGTIDMRTSFLTNIASGYDDIIDIRASSSNNIASGYDDIIGMRASFFTNIASGYDATIGMHTSSSTNISSGYDATIGMHTSSLSNIVSRYDDSLPLQYELDQDKTFDFANLTPGLTENQMVPFGGDMAGALDCNFSSSGAMQNYHCSLNNCYSSNFHSMVEKFQGSGQLVVPPVSDAPYLGSTSAFNDNPQIDFSQADNLIPIMQSLSEYPIKDSLGKFTLEIPLGSNMQHQDFDACFPKFRNE